MVREVSLSLLYVFCAIHVASASATWRYGDNWGEKCAQVGTQSPIDLNLATASPAPLWNGGDLVLKRNGACTQAEFETSLHTSQVKVRNTCKDVFQTFFANKNYSLEQFQWHSPSEHTLNGKRFPMEVQYVHKSPADGSVLVIAVLIAVYSDGQVDATHGGLKKDSDFVADMQNRMVWGFAPADVTQSVPWTTGGYGPYDFIPLNRTGSGFLTYEGSITTPPCTTGVRWIIPPVTRFVNHSTLQTYLTGINKISNNQLATFKTITGNDVPEWDPYAWQPVDLQDSWNAGEGTNSRKIQQLIGAQNPARKLYDVAPFPLSNCGGKPEPGAHASSQSSSLNLPTIAGLIILGSCCCILCALVACSVGRKSTKRGWSQADEESSLEEDESE